MKNSQETIALPTFSVQLVRQSGDDFVIEETCLGDLIASHDQGLILYFYPKDNTPGCSTQATDFSDQLAQFANLGYQVVGVSRDGLKSHQNFIQKKGINFGLISDPDETLCQHFGVIQEKMLYGKTHLGVVRSTFVFDKTGQLTASFRNVKAKEHAENLFAFLNQ